MPQFRTVAKILFALIATPLYAETNGVLRIGVLNDMSSVYSDFQGPGSVIAARGGGDRGGRDGVHDGSFRERVGWVLSEVIQATRTLSGWSTR